MTKDTYISKRGTNECKAEVGKKWFGEKMVWGKKWFGEKMVWGNVLQRHFLGGFRKTARSEYQRRHVCRSVRSHGTTQLPRDKFFIKSDF